MTLEQAVAETLGNTPAPANGLTHRQSHHVPDTRSNLSLSVNSKFFA